MFESGKSCVMGLNCFVVGKCNCGCASYSEVIIYLKSQTEIMLNPLYMPLSK